MAVLLAAMAAAPRGSLCRVPRRMQPHPPAVRAPPAARQWRQQRGPDGDARGPHGHVSLCAWRCPPYIGVGMPGSRSGTQVHHVAHRPCTRAATAHVLLRPVCASARACAVRVRAPYAWTRVRVTWQWPRGRGAAAAYARLRCCRSPCTAEGCRDSVAEPDRRGGGRCSLHASRLALHASRRVCAITVAMGRGAVVHRLREKEKRGGGCVCVCAARRRVASVRQPCARAAGGAGTRSLPALCRHRGAVAGWRERERERLAAGAH